MIHETLRVIDGQFLMFESSNLDARSSEINDELDVVVYDPNFGPRDGISVRKLMSEMTRQTRCRAI
jgi:phosphatidylserine/phosphatidylglycerophosphate/cardiolipin synthase-like enzyme